jgi:flavin reductase (DIM6/NTAB) family NADH-FMN oxidoreductase RutF
VVLVTTEVETANGIVRRGLTVSSFTTICLTPSPFICFSTRQTSRAADLIAVRQFFTVHVLPCTLDAAKLAEAFSKSDLAPFSSANPQNPFELGQWTRDEQWQLPVLDGVLGTLLCKVEKVVDVGDHKLLIAEVQDVMENTTHGTALAYCGRKYRGEGEPIWPHDAGDDQKDSGQL